MGWTESEIQNELLSRCKHRIQYMEEAVSSRNALAAAHSSYAYGLQKIGAALTDYISEALSHHSSSVTTPATARIFIPRRLLPSPSSPATLQTAVGLPEIHQQLVELSQLTVPEMEPQMKPIKKLGKTGKLMSLIQIFHILHNHFLMASEGAHEVYQILANFADSRGHIGHPSDTEKNITPAVLLGIILAWEEKLYNEVQVGETMKHKYQKKVASLNMEDKLGTIVESLVKSEAPASVVNMQSMDSTLAQINGLRDEQLYPKLL